MESSKDDNYNMIKNVDADTNSKTNINVDTDNSAKYKIDKSDENNKILAKLETLQKRKHDNEHSIRVLEKTKISKMREMNRELRKKQIEINKIIIKNNDKDNDVTNDLPLISVISQTNLRNEMRQSNTKTYNKEKERQIDILLKLSAYNTDVERLQSEIDELKENTYNEIEEIDFEIKEKKIEIKDIIKSMKNNWGEENEETLRKWIHESNMQNFIYERVREVMQKKFRRLTLFLTILTGVLSLLTVSDLGIDQTKYKTLLMVIKIVVAVISFVSFIVTAYIKHAKIEDKIQDYTSYIGKLVNFTSNLSTIVDVKPELRPDADKFITDNRTTYSLIHRDSPHIDNKYYDKSKIAYDKYVLDMDVEKDAYNYNYNNNKNNDNNYGEKIQNLKYSTINDADNANTIFQNNVDNLDNNDNEGDDLNNDNDSHLENTQIPNYLPEKKKRRKKDVEK